MPKPPKETSIEEYFNQQFERIFPQGQNHKYEARRSEPDRICLLPNGIAVFVELKRPGETLRPEQVRAAIRLGELGFDVFWANTKARVDEILAELAAKYGPDPNGCPECGGPYIPLRSMNKKICNGCGATVPWKLKEGQKPLLQCTR